jgi:hypothetical protein
MDINRRMVMISLGLAATAGLAFPAILTRSAEPQLVQPLTITDTEGAAASGGTASQTPSEVPIKPVPVVPLGLRDDNARTNVDDDQPDDPGADGDDGDDGDDTNNSNNRNVRDATGNGQTGDGGGGGGGDDSAPGGDATDDGGSSDG